jgi:hypothetical protein
LYCNGKILTDWPIVAYILFNRRRLTYWQIVAYILFNRRRLTYWQVVAYILFSRRRLTYWPIVAYVMFKFALAHVLQTAYLDEMFIYRRIVLKSEPTNYKH